MMGSFSPSKKGVTFGGVRSVGSPLPPMSRRVMPGQRRTPFETAALKARKLRGQVGMGGAASALGRLVPRM